MKGGPIKLTLLIGGSDNITMKLTPFVGGKGGSDQADTSLSGGGDSPHEAIVKISER